jgi:signal transduction histidine kinase
MDNDNLMPQIAAYLERMFYVDDSGQSDVLQHVLDSTRELLNAEICALFLTDYSEESLVLERVSGQIDFEKIKEVSTYRIKNYDPNQKGTGVTPWVLFRKQPFNAGSFEELQNNSEGHWKGNWDGPIYGGSDKARYSFQCVYMVPLLAGNRAIGVLKYENRKGDKKYFDRSDEIVIDTIAGLVTNLVISQRIERNRYDHILPKISSILVSDFGLETFYEKLLEECCSILHADLCSLFLLDNRRNNLMLRSIVGVSDDIKTKLKNFGYDNYKTSQGLTPWILIRKAPFNVRSFPDLKGRSEGHHLGKWDGIVYHGKPEEEFISLYSIPLIIGDERIGVFKIENKNVPPYYFTESDERLFDLIGRLIAVGVKYENMQDFGLMIRAAELGFLASGISHEFNTYLQRFGAASENVQSICNDLLAKEKIQKIIDEIDKASEVIDNFRQIKNRTQEVERFDLDKLMNEIIDLTHEKFKDSKIEITYDNNGIAEVRLNPSEIQTIVINLLNNAFESIVESKKSGFVEVSISPVAQDTFCIEVADSGKGIAKDELEYIFAPFYTSKAPTGMGVGLFWVHRIVNNMKGEIRVEPSNQYNGATFTVTLPRKI